MAGMAGLEPADEGVKVPCLTTWRHPCVEKRKEGLGSLPIPLLRVGWVMGLEPTTPGTTIRCSNQLSYTHHVCPRGILITDKIGTPEGTRTPGLLLRRQLLYPTELLAQIDKVGAGDGNRTRIPSLEGWCPSHCATPACPPKIVSSHIISYDLVSVKEKIRKVVKKSTDFFAKIAVAQR